MLSIGDAEFRDLVADGIDAVPALYQKHLQNVAFIVEDEPTQNQREKLHLACNDLLFGLYEGTPLPQRGGMTKILPDKISIFKKPLEAISRDVVDLREKIRHTIWHEVAHYYGLDHDRIHAIERKKFSG